MSSKREFLVRLDSLADGWFRLVKKFENFELHKRSNLSSIKEKMNDFNRRLLKEFRELENLLKVKNDPNLSDSYFIHMRMMELTGLEKKYDRFEREFRELEQFVEEEMRNLTQKTATKELDLFGKSTKKRGVLYDVHDDDFEQLMINFVREHLKFRCPSCDEVIPFGEDRCDACDQKQDWWYDIDETIDRLQRRAMRNPEFTCPNEGCGAMIQLDWENCAFCGLDIQKMLHTMIFFD